MKKTYLLPLIFFPLGALALDNFKASAVKDIPVGTDSVQILAAKTSRKYLYIMNTGSQIVYVKPASLHAANEGVGIPITNGVWNPEIPPAEAIFAKSASGTQTLKVIEGE
jgi:hypothetical protein